MISAIIAFVVAIAVVITLTPIVRRVALDIGAVDAPGPRRVHGRVIARLGGIGVAIAFFVPQLVLFGLETEVARLFLQEPKRIVGLVAGGLLMCGVGIVDDLRGVRAWTKLWLQVAAATIAFMSGYRIDAIAIPFIGHLDMGVFALPVTILWITAIVNAINLIDGLDGLAGGVAFFACVTNFVVATIHQDPLVMLLSASLGGAALGFLLFNWSPASIFMGDSGSLFLGFILAVTAIRGSAIKSSTTVAILVPLIALGLPIMDTLFAMVRRILERRPIFSPDRGHIHHRLLALGMNQRKAVTVLYGLTVLFTLGAILISMERSWQVGGAMFILSLAVIGVVRAMGNLDTMLRRWRPQQRSHTVERLRKAVPPTLTRIAAAKGVDDLQGVLVAFAQAAELATVELTECTIPRVACFAWNREDGPSEASEPELEQITCSYGISAAGPAASLRFSWQSDQADAGADVDILLQLVADALEQRIVQGDAARVPATKGHLRSV